MKYVINGGKKLRGSVNISGSKNAVLPILASTIVTKKRSVIHNCPKLSDVASTIRILQHLGCNVCYDKGTLVVDAKDSCVKDVPEELMRALRSSVIFLGAFIADKGEGNLPYPGGCELGKRPIDIHVDILKKMGAEIVENEGSLDFKYNRLKGGEYVLPFPSIGATENIILASLAADGDVIIRNAASEPEIKSLAAFLNRAGAEIAGAGTDCIIIKKDKNFRDCEYTVISDRIETATYMAAAAVTGSTITLKNAPVDDIKSTVSAFESIGCKVLIKKDELTIIAPGRLKATDMISTAPYPGFPTDAQPVLTACLINSKGTSLIAENIFEKRFNHVPELRKLGANINVFGNTLKIKGNIDEMYGGNVVAGDLRAGAALIVAALGIKEQVMVEDSHHIIRGYENIVPKLEQLGADIKIV